MVTCSDVTCSFGCEYHRYLVPYLRLRFAGLRTQFNSILPPYFTCFGALFSDCLFTLRILRLYYRHMEYRPAFPPFRPSDQNRSITVDIGHSLILFALLIRPYPPPHCSISYILGNGIYSNVSSLRKKHISLNYFTSFQINSTVNLFCLEIKCSI
jgi:hypothetical protein